MGVGSSKDPDSAVAARQATAQALDGREAALVIVFCGAGHDPSVVASTVGDSARGSPMIGCSTAGEITRDGAEDSSVVVTAIGGPGLSVVTRTTSNASADLVAAGAVVAESVEEFEPRRHRALLLLADCRAGDQEQIIRGAYSVVGAETPLVGGCSGDYLASREIMLLHDGAAMADAVVAAAISSDGPVGIGYSHGWRIVGEPMLVTASSNNRVFSLDDQPALDVYLERLEAPAAARHDPTAFARFAQTHPLALNHRSGEAVRFITDADFDDRSLGCIADVPTGGLAWFMVGSTESVLTATNQACGRATDALGGKAPVGLLAFDCVGRRGVLEDQVDEEVARIVACAGDAPVAGFYTFGEIARTSGISGFHNHTLVVLALA